MNSSSTNLPTSATDTAQQSKSDTFIYIRSYLIYALMVAAAATVCYFAIKQGGDYGPTTFMTILGFITFFIILERIIPHKKSWHPTGKEWLRDSGYFTLVCIAGALGQGLVLSIVVNFTHPVPQIPLYGEVIAGLLIASFAGYWFHRIAHVNRFLWRVHGVHHTPKKVNLANNSVTHFIDVIGPAIVTQVPLFALNFSAESMFIATVFTAMQGYFVHANADFRMGKLSYIIATPEAHRLHHSMDLTEAGNFGSDIVLWDILFGSFSWQENRQPLDVGVVSPASFPPTGAIHKMLVHPFVYLVQNLWIMVKKPK